MRRINAPNRIANSEAPDGWWNVYPQGDNDRFYLDRLRIATNLIKWSTLTSGINNDLLETTMDHNIRALRTALWLKHRQQAGAGVPHAGRANRTGYKAFAEIPCRCGGRRDAGPRCGVPPRCRQSGVQTTPRRGVRIRLGKPGRAHGFISGWKAKTNRNRATSSLGFSSTPSRMIRHRTRGSARPGCETYPQPCIPFTNETRWCTDFTTWKLRICRPPGAGGPANCVKPPNHCASGGWAGVPPLADGASHPAPAEEPETFDGQRRTTSESVRHSMIG